MKVFFQSTLILLAFCVFSLPFSAQESAAESSVNPVEKPKVTIKVDEFGRLGDCDASARVDNLFIQLNNIKDAKGYIITYSGLDLLPSQFNEPPILRQIKSSIMFRRFDLDRVVFIDGGFREKQGGEMFIVPFGSVLPEPSNTIAASKAPTGTFVWGKSVLENESEYLGLDEFRRDDVKAKRVEEERLAELEDSIERAKNGDHENRVDESVAEEPTAIEEVLSPEKKKELRFEWVNLGFGVEMTKRKGSSGTLIFYADNDEYDTAKLEKFVEEGRDILVASGKLRREQINVIFGGYRDYPVVEYHLIAKNGKAPQAKPDERPDPVTDEPTQN